MVSTKKISIEYKQKKMRRKANYVTTYKKKINEIERKAVREKRRDKKLQDNKTIKIEKISSFI